jgi:diguanylate cyclase (GGDEF)-like protein
MGPCCDGGPRSHLRQTVVISLRNLKIRNQVFLLTLPLVLFLLAVIGLVCFNYWQISRINRLVEDSELSALRTESLLQGVNEMDALARAYVLTGGEEFFREYTTASQLVARDFDAIRDLNLHSPSILARLENLESHVEDWKSQVADPAIEQAKAGMSGSEVSASSKWGGDIVAIQKGIGELREENQNLSSAGRKARQRDMYRAVVSVAVLAAFFAVLLLFMVHFVSRSISEPVHLLIRASDRLRQGDFDPLMPQETRGEFGVLSRSFLQMAHALRRDREELSGIKRFSEAVTECTSEDEVYDHLLHAFRDRFQPQQIIIFKLRPEEDFLEVVASLSPLPQNVQDWPVIEGKHSCKAVRMGRSFRVNDVTVEPLCPGKFVLPHVGSYYCGPLIAGGIIIGAVRIEGPAGLWTPERESLVESYLSTSASVLSNLQLLQTMREQANIDPLTGLYNRRFCKDYARKMMAMARRRDAPLGFIMLDLDHFKSINDVYGHEIGDRILKQFAKIVTQSMRETNLTARLGGEEFIILLPDTGASACQVVAERIRNAVTRMSMPQVKDSQVPPVTVSLGIAVYPEHGATLEEMLAASDRALYESKRAGRNRSTLYVEEKETTG